MFLNEKIVIRRKVRTISPSSCLVSIFFITRKESLISLRRVKCIVLKIRLLGVGFNLRNMKIKQVLQPASDYPTFARPLAGNIR